MTADAGRFTPTVALTVVKLDEFVSHAEADQKP